MSYEFTYGAEQTVAKTVQTDLRHELVLGEVAAEVRLYDGRTLNQIARYDLHKRNMAVVPMSIGIGGRSLSAWIALPFVQYGQYRAAAHEVARQAAERIAGR